MPVVPLTPDINSNSILLQSSLKLFSKLLPNTDASRRRRYYQQARVRNVNNIASCNTAAIGCGGDYEALITNDGTNSDIYAYNLLVGGPLMSHPASTMLYDAYIKGDFYMPELTGTGIFFRLMDTNSDGATCYISTDNKVRCYHNVNAFGSTPIQAATWHTGKILYTAASSVAAADGALYYWMKTGQNQTLSTVCPAADCDIQIDTGTEINNVDRVMLYTDMTSTTHRFDNIVFDDMDPDYQCSGTWPTNWEEFETGVDNTFCTTGPAVVEPDAGIITTNYSAGWEKGGNSSVRVNHSSTTGSTNYMYFPATPDDQDQWYGVSFYQESSPSVVTQLGPFQCGHYSGSTIYYENKVIFYYTYYDGVDELEGRIYLYDDSIPSLDWFDYEGEKEYRLILHCIDYGVGSVNSRMYLEDAYGKRLKTNFGNYYVDKPGRNQLAVDYFFIKDDSTIATSTYIDSDSIRSGTTYGSVRAVGVGYTSADYNYITCGTEDNEKFCETWDSCTSFSVEPDSCSSPDESTWVADGTDEWLASEATGPAGAGDHTAVYTGTGTYNLYSNTALNLNNGTYAKNSGIVAKWEFKWDLFDNTDTASFELYDSGNTATGPKILLTATSDSAFTASVSGGAGGDIATGLVENTWYEVRVVDVDFVNEIYEVGIFARAGNLKGSRATCDFSSDTADEVDQIRLTGIATGDYALYVNNVYIGGHSYDTFASWEENDPSGDITITPYTITVDTMTDDGAMVDKFFGTDYFSGDFDITFEVELSSVDVDGIAGIFLLCDADDANYADIGATCVGIFYDKNIDYWRFMDDNETLNQQDAYYGGEYTTRYFHMWRTGTTIYLRITNDKNGLDIVGSTRSLTNATAFDYISLAWEGYSANSWSGVIRNLEIKSPLP